MAGAEKQSVFSADMVLWYDPDLNFVVKVLGVSKEGINWGMSCKTSMLAASNRTYSIPPFGYRQILPSTGYLMY